MSPPATPPTILADGPKRTATVLAGNFGKRLDATLKHLVALRGAGLVVTAENPQDVSRHPHDEDGTRLGDGLWVLFGAVLK